MDAETDLLSRLAHLGLGYSGPASPRTGAGGLLRARPLRASAAIGAKTQGTIGRLIVMATRRAGCIPPRARSA